MAKTAFDVLGLDLYLIQDAIQPLKGREVPAVKRQQNQEHLPLQADQVRKDLERTASTLKDFSPCQTAGLARSRTK